MANLTAHQKAHILQQDLPAFIDTLMGDIREPCAHDGVRAHSLGLGVGDFRHRISTRQK